MDNETKLSEEQINSIKQELSEKKTDLDLNEFMAKHLNDKQKQAVMNIASDPEKLKAIMNSPIAKKLMEKFSKE